MNRALEDNVGIYNSALVWLTWMLKTPRISLSISVTNVSKHNLGEIVDLPHWGRKLIERWDILLIEIKSRSTQRVSPDALFLL